MGDPDDVLEWIERSRGGDHAAFASLISHHQRMVHSLAFRMTGSSADAEDLAQETFLRCYERLGTYRGESKFSTWLYRIALRVCLNWRKRAEIRERVHAEWSASAYVPADGVPAGPDESGRRVQEALLRLPPKQRAAIVLTVHEDLSHDAAARILGCSEATVSWRVFSARKKLKRWLSAPEVTHG